MQTPSTSSSSQDEQGPIGPHSAPGNTGVPGTDDPQANEVSNYLERWGLDAPPGRKSPFKRPPAPSKHRRKLVIRLKRYGVSSETTVAEFNATKTPPWVKRRKNRAANKVARRARRVNRMRGA